jgi:O-antigen/teichoic acid export membrane protein
MVLQSILRAVSSYKFFQESAHRPARDPQVSREFLTFSRIVLASSTLTLLIGQSDKLILGRLFTLDEFGLYAIALTIASAPTAFCSSYVRRIVFPVYAQTWREAPEQLPRVYYDIRRAASALYAFGSGGLIGGASLLVALLYDPRYGPASLFISLLMIGSALRLPNLAAAELMTAIGEIRETLRINVVRLVWLCMAIPSGFLLFRAIGVVAAVGLSEVPAMFYCWLLVRRAGVLDMRKELVFLTLVAAGAAVGFAGGNELLKLFPRL